METAAQLDGELWLYNFARIVIVDVSDDYELMQAPMPSECYPVLGEVWLPCHQLTRTLPSLTLVEGYLYDWHQTPTVEIGAWYVGVVREDVTDSLHERLAAL